MFPLFQKFSYLESIDEYLAFLAPDFLLPIGNHGLNLHKVDRVGIEIGQLISEDVSIDGALVLLDGRVGHGSRFGQTPTPKDLVFTDRQIRFGR